MAKPCSSKPKKSPLKKNLDEDETPSTKCKLKVNTSLVFNSDDFLVKRKQNDKNLGSNNLNINQNPLSTGKLKFQCHYEERKRRDELRRKKIIQNLKYNYKINVEGFSEDVTREIIKKAELIEREKKLREKRNIERSVAMITRLLEEQKYKNRGKKPCRLPWKKSMKNILREPCIEKDEFEKCEEFGEVDSACISELGEKSETSHREEEKSPSAEIKEAEKSTQEEKTKILPKCKDVMRGEDSDPDIVRRPRRPLCVPTEMCLESTPKSVVFQDYKKGKVYLQDLKITNIGTETIHCRYLGIVVHTKTEDRFPVGVAVRDNVKLSPGLSCSTKIRLCSQDDTNKLKCSIVYETRRLENPSQYSWFFVEVVCVPTQAIVKVIPTKITFPSLTWCESNDPKNIQLMKKVLKIKNSGGKGCSCKISSENVETNLNEEYAEEEEDVEEEYETVSTFTKSIKSEVFKNRSKNLSKIEEFHGEDDLLFRDEAIQTSVILIDELIDNVFANFRFYPKYYIELPPHSTTQVEVRFIPQYKGFHHEMFIVQFDDCDNCQQEHLEVKGDIKKIPIRTEPEMIDFKTCVSNSGVYAGTFKVFNDSKALYSILLRVPAAIKEHAHVHPKAATIQPYSSSDFSVRFYPRVTLARDAPQYYKKDSKILEFPVFIYDANSRGCKKDRIKIYVFALITNYCLQLFPSFINFETVTTLETVRAELELTNHSLAIQEYGFLNLPKGVRIEPNMGFGKILPKEKIKLYLLYSPGEDLIKSENPKEAHEFLVEVTTIAEYGGFREKLEREEESIELWGEDYNYEYPPVEEESEFEFLPEEEEEGSDDIDICEEYSSDEDKEIIKIEEQEKKIRDFLKENRDKKSELSFFKRMDVQAKDHERSITTVRESLKDIDDYEVEEEEEELEKSLSLKENLNIVICRAFIMRPRCRLSASVIQLPATPCSSFSLYCFRLSALNEPPVKNCSCGFQKVSKKDLEKPGFKGSFEFQYFCPHIKLEPESGFIEAGDSISIKIIFRPEFPAEELRKKSRAKKAEKMAQERKVEKETPRTTSKQSKTKRNASVPKSVEINPENAIEEIINASLFELENYDLFAGERSLQELISPFYVETKLLCIIKTFQCGDETEKTEIHEMVLICPAIKPSFIYLGTSQEIRFNKVLIGTRPRVLLKVQNISFERISPLATLLNPVGSFHCPAGVKRVEVDPEHIWQQPLVYAPLKCKGVEKEFFEIYYNSTNIFLTVSGEGIEPEFKINPNFASCLIGAKPGGTEEIKLEIENLTKLKLNLNIDIGFSKIGPDLEKLEKVEDDTKSKKTEKEGTTDSRKSKNVEKNTQFWDEIPETISTAMKNLVDMTECDKKAFNLAGVGNNNEVLVPPSGKQQFKIQFAPPPDKSNVRYANKYIIMLEKASPLKEMLVMGKIIGGK